MITAGEFRNGVTFEMDGQVCQVVEFQHVKPGKGAAFVRVKMRNVISGGVTERTFNPSDKFENAYIERREKREQVKEEISTTGLAGGFICFLSLTAAKSTRKPSGVINKPGTSSMSST